MLKLFTIMMMLTCFIGNNLLAEGGPFFKGFSLTEEGAFIYSANLKAQSDAEKTDAQRSVDAAKRLGANHIILMPRAIMLDPNGNDVIPLTKPKDRIKERGRYKDLIQYIHNSGMSVGIRPILFVVKDEETMTFWKDRWHGNITPKDPNLWFDSFKSYLDIYIACAKQMNVRADFFTIGAELYSMTVGIEDYWKEYPHGFPGHWLRVLKYVRSKLGNDVKLMYDINFTDDTISTSGGIKEGGGELARWRYRLADLAPEESQRGLPNPNDPENPYQSWYDLRDFWNTLDFVGIDMYRSLVGKTDKIASEYNALVEQLHVRTDRFAGDLDLVMSSIQSVINPEAEMMKPVIFKEVGYRSSEKGFLDPFVYDSQSDIVNLSHQSAAYQAFFESFWDIGFSWFSGALFWDVAINPARQGVKDPGFTPIGKKQTEDIIFHYFSMK